jgi:uncharacterized membrane protein
MISGAMIVPPNIALMIIIFIMGYLIGSIMEYRHIEKCIVWKKYGVDEIL